MRYIKFLHSWFQEKSQKILATSACLMIAGLSFVGGTLFQKDRTAEEPKLVITVPDYQVKESADTTTPASTEGSLSSVVKGVATTEGESQANCLYVGSKNSDKYHKATCGVVKRIKMENRRCFASPQIAEASGYKPGCVQ